VPFLSLATAAVPATPASTSLPVAGEGAGASPPMPWRRLISSMAALAASLAICVAASTEFPTMDAGLPASGAAGASSPFFGLDLLLAASFATAPSAAGTALPAASVWVDALDGLDFALGFEAVFFVVGVLPVLLGGCVLVAAASRARTRRIHVTDITPSQG